MNTLELWHTKHQVYVTVFLSQQCVRTPSFMLFLLKTHVRPLMEYASCVWNTGYRTDLVKLSECKGCGPDI